MTEEHGTLSTPVKVPARTNVYTALLLVALLMLVAGACYVGYRNNQLFGSPLPLQPVSQNSSR